MAKTWSFNPFTGKLDVDGDNTKYVPYTGATAAVNLGSQQLRTTGQAFLNIISSGPNTDLKLEAGSSSNVLLVPSYNNAVYMTDSAGTTYKFGYIEYFDQLFAYVNVKADAGITLKAGQKLIFDGD